MVSDPLNQIRFDDQVAIVTGAGGGLGRTYALALAERGARVLVNDLGCARDGTGSSPVAAEAVAAEICAAGGQAIANCDSVATPEGGEQIVQAALQTYGRVDILINNAGIICDKSFPRMTPEMWSEVIAVHLDGAYNVTHSAFLAMREQKYGRIVFITSSAGLFGNFGQANYGAAKMGLVGLMNCLKLEGERYNVNLNCVAPLAFTRINEEIIPEGMQSSFKPEYVTPLVLYLCARESLVTGGIYNAAMGYFSRTALVTGPAIRVCGSGQSPTIEEVAQQWNEINTVGDQVFNDAMSALFAMKP